MPLTTLTAIAVLAATCGSAHVPAAAPSLSPLSTLDRARGFTLLTGHDYETQWRSYRGKGFPEKGWFMTGGVLTHAKAGGGGDIITTEQYGDFEFVFEFKTAPGANSGVKYHCTEKHDAAWMTGPEYQILDDSGGEGGKPIKADDSHSVAGLYDLYSPSADKPTKPAGEWNTGRIVMRNGITQHWLNGAKVIETRMFDESGKPTPEWLAKIAGSKFKAYDGFGIQPRGHIGLQDHGDEVSYRNVMVRDLDAPMPGEVRLFNGTDLTGWTAIVPDLAGKTPGPESVWSVKDGILTCAGNPIGYLRTSDKHDNFVLRLQWRWNPETKKAGNSGVLVRMVGEDKVWPKSVEAQLQSGSAGDFWNIGEFPMTVPADRTKGRNTKATHAAERPIGEWNDYEIIVYKGDVILNVNGEELNRAAAVQEVPGYICLQSEGTEIQFKDIRLAPLN